MSTISNLIQQQSNPYYQFVNELVQIKSQQKYTLQGEEKQLTTEKSSLSKVSSVISSFTAKIDELNSKITNNFNPFKATSSNTSAVTVNSISGMKSANTYDISVARTASKDITLSNVYSGSSTSLAASGNGSVDVTIGGKTATISVNTTHTDGTSMTNKEILDSISTSINSLLGNETDSAVYQVDNNGNVQLSLKSAQTGYSQRIQFSNATGVMANITGNMTHQISNLNNLDAQFTIDGITFTRGQNTVSDAISGMTFTLKSATTGQEQINVTQDVDKATSNINDFIKKFNDMNTQIRQQTFLNGKTGNKGPLQGMHSIRNLTLNLRQTALLDMGSAATGAYKNLTDIGIGFEKDGTMKVTDSQLLQNALTQNPDQVKALFENSDSPVMQMYNQAKAFTDVGGTIATLKDGLDQNIKYLDNRIKTQTQLIAKYQKNLKAKFDKMYQVQLQAQSQYNTIMSMAGTLSSTTSSTSSTTGS